MFPSYFTDTRVMLEAVSRRNCRAVQLNERRALCRVLGKYIFYADPNDIGLTPHLCLDGFWESWITLAVARLIQPGWRCVDVGANHGYYTLLLADGVGSEGRVLAIEPNPKLASLIRLSLEVNGLHGRGDVLEKAASDSANRMALVVPRNQEMNATLRRQATEADDVIEVETATIDQMVSDWPCIDFIKIDAEGSEEAIWKGMSATLLRNPKITIVMEMTCSRYDDPVAFVRRIREAGFALRHIDYDGSVKQLSANQILNNRTIEPWMLFLQR